MRVTGIVIGFMLASSVMGQAQESPFSALEKAEVRAYWAAPERYRTERADRWQERGVWQVRLNPAASEWLLRFFQARSNGKVNPTRNPPPRNDQERRWDAWIQAKIAFDRHRAGLECQAKNLEEAQLKLPDLGAPPGDPGPAPADLLAQFPAPPVFARAVKPTRHVVTFDDGTVIALTDNAPMRADYPYYRFENGVMSGGQKVADMPDDQLARLFDAAGIDASVMRVMQAVSLLEGGFDSVNTYDTGFVSVGLLQFASLRAGSGSLGGVLLRQKTFQPGAFQRDFRRFGVDVTPDGVLVAMDPATGAVFQGPDANQRIINDRRLIAVFQRAGRVSTEFRVAQLMIAKERFFPGDDAVEIQVAGRTLRGTVRDVFRTEAGLATLMDLKVNTGNIRPVMSVLARFAQDIGADSLDDLAAIEYDLIRAVTYRESYLDNLELSRPRETGSAASRQGDRNTRGPRGS